MSRLTFSYESTDVCGRGRGRGRRRVIVADALRGYVDHDLDVLVCSSVLGEGVDGLQDIGSRLIINCPPWTDGAYDQLVARWLRTGQKNTVQVVIPLTYFTRPDGLRVSLDVDRLARIGHRASIADAVLDGTIPATFITEAALRDRAVALLSDQLGGHNEREDARSQPTPQSGDLYQRKSLDTDGGN